MPGGASSHDMNLTGFLARLFFHASSAASVFAIATIAMESLMPGSVLPYLNPIPFAIVGLAGLSASAAITEDAVGPLWRGRVLLGVSALLAAGSFLLFAGEDGRLGAIVIAWFVISAIRFYRGGLS